MDKLEDIDDSQSGEILEILLNTREQGQMMEQQNIDPYQTNAGEPFDASIHQPKLEATDNPALDKTIKESLSEGYRKRDKVLLPERVAVYQYKNME